jgi:uncharacterized protein
MMPSLADASPWIWAGFAVAELALPIFLGLVMEMLPPLRPFFAGDRAHWLRFWMTTLASLWVATGIVVLLMLQGGVGPAMVGLRTPGHTLAVAVSVVIVALALGALIAGARAAGPGPTAHPALFLPHTRGERLLMVLVIAPSAAVCEELLYRGYVLGFLQPTIGLLPANLVQSLLFGFHHGGIRQGTRALVARAAIGCAFGLIATRAGTLTAVIAIHYLFDAALTLRPSPEAAVHASRARRVRFSRSP